MAKRTKKWRVITMKLKTKIFISNDGDNRDLGNIRLSSATVDSASLIVDQ